MRYGKVSIPTSYLERMRNKEIITLMIDEEALVLHPNFTWWTTDSDPTEIPEQWVRKELDVS